MVTLEDKGKLLARALHLGSHVDRPPKQRAIIESTVALCRVMPASLISQIYESVKMVCKNITVCRLYCFHFRKLLTYKTGERAT